MKKIISFFFLVAFAATSFGQQIDQKHPLPNSDYQSKSKKQKKTATILLAVGAGLIVTSVVIPKGELTYDGICVLGVCDDKYKNDGIKSAFFIAGGISALGSIPFFIASSKNRKRANALSASFKTDNIAIARSYNFTRINYPAFSLKIMLK